MARRLDELRRLLDELQRGSSSRSSYQARSERLQRIQSVKRLVSSSEVVELLSGHEENLEEGGEGSSLRFAECVKHLVDILDVEMSWADGEHKKSSGRGSSVQTRVEAAQALRMTVRTAIRVDAFDSLVGLMVLRFLAKVLAKREAGLTVGTATSRMKDNTSIVSTMNPAMPGMTTTMDAIVVEELWYLVGDILETHEATRARLQLHTTLMREWIRILAEVKHISASERVLGLLALETVASDACRVKWEILQLSTVELLSESKQEQLIGGGPTSRKVEFLAAVTEILYSSPLDVLGQNFFKVVTAGVPIALASWNIKRARSVALRFALVLSRYPFLSAPLLHHFQAKVRGDLQQMKSRGEKLVREQDLEFFRLTALLIPLQDLLKMASDSESDVIASVCFQSLSIALESCRLSCQWSSDDISTVVRCIGELSSNPLMNFSLDTVGHIASALQEALQFPLHLFKSHDVFRCFKGLLTRLFGTKGWRLTNDVKTARCIGVIVDLPDEVMRPEQFRLALSVTDHEKDAVIGIEQFLRLFDGSTIGFKLFWRLLRRCGLYGSFGGKVLELVGTLLREAISKQVGKAEGISLRGDQIGLLAVAAIGGEFVDSSLQDDIFSSERSFPDSISVLDGFFSQFYNPHRDCLLNREIICVGRICSSTRPSSKQIVSRSFFAEKEALENNFVSLGRCLDWSTSLVIGCSGSQALTSAHYGTFLAETYLQILSSRGRSPLAMSRGLIGGHLCKVLDKVENLKEEILFSSAGRNFFGRLCRLSRKGGKEEIDEKVSRWVSKMIRTCFLRFRRILSSHSPNCRRRDVKHEDAELTHHPRVSADGNQRGALSFDAEDADDLSRNIAMNQHFDHDVVVDIISDLFSENSLPKVWDAEQLMKNALDECSEFLRDVNLTQDPSCVAFRCAIWKRLSRCNNPFMTLVVTQDARRMVDHFTTVVENESRSSSKGKWKKSNLSGNLVNRELCYQELLLFWIDFLEMFASRDVCDSDEMQITATCFRLLDHIRLFLGWDMARKSRILFVETVKSLRLVIEKGSAGSDGPRKQLNDFERVLEKLASDEDAVVRMVSALGSVEIATSQVTKAISLQCLPLIEGELDLDHFTSDRDIRATTGLSHGITSIIVIGELAVKHEPSRAASLFGLCERLLNGDGVSVVVIKAVFARISLLGNFQNISRLFSLYSKELLGKWNAKYGDLESFPIDAANLDDPELFYLSFVEDILPLALVSSEENEEKQTEILDHVYKLTGYSSLSSLIEDQVCTVWSALPGMRLSARLPMIEKLSSLVPRLHAPPLRKTLKLIFSCIDQPETLTSPLYSGQDAELVIQELIQDMFGSTKATRNYEPDLLILVLIDLWEMFDGPGRPSSPRRRYCGLQGLNIWFSIVGDFLLQIPTAIFLCYRICLVGLHHNDTVQGCLRLMEDLTMKVLSLEFSPGLTYIMQELFPEFLFQAEIYDIQDDFKVHLIDIITTFVRQAPLAVIGSEDLFPQSNDFEELRKAWSNRHSPKGLPLNGEYRTRKSLEVLPRSPHILPPRLAMSSLLPRLKSLSDNLNSEIEGALDQGRDELEMLVSALVQLGSNSLGSTPYYLEVLNLIGVCCGHVFARLGGLAPRFSIVSSGNHQRNFGETDPDQSRAGHRVALELLAATIIGESAYAAGVAASTVSSILSSSAGATAYSDLADHTKAIIASFLRSRKSRRSDASRGLEHPKGSSASELDSLALDDDELWGLAESNSSEWSSALAVSLIHRNLGDHEVLGLCGAICSACPTISSELLPYIIAKVVDEVRDARTVIARRLHDSVFSNDRCLSDTCSLALRCVNFLREVSISVMKRVTAPETGTFVSRRKSSLPEKLTQPVCILDISYVLVAQAANRCGSPATALLFAEYAMYEQMDALERSESSKKRKLDEEPEYEYRWSSIIQEDALRVSIDALQALGDTDALSGIVNGELALNLNLDSILHEQKQDWNGALATHSAQLNSKQSIIRASAEAGVMRCLKNMGLYPLIAHHWVGLLERSESWSSSDAEDKVKHELSETRYEAAWRLGEWEPLPALFTRSRGFHQGFHECLRRLVTLDINSCLEGIRDVRVAVVKEIIASSQATAAIFRDHLAHLELLNFLEAEIDTTTVKRSGSSPTIDIMSRCTTLPLSTETHAIIRLELSKAFGRVDDLARLSADLATIVASRGSQHLARADGILSDVESTDALKICSPSDRAIWNLARSNIDAARGSTALAVTRLLRVLVEDLGASSTPNETGFTIWQVVEDKFDVLPLLRALVCRKAAEWTYALQTEDVRSIFDVYLRGSISAFAGRDTGDELGRCFYEMGEFAGRVYHRMSTRMESREYTLALLVIEQQMGELEKCRAALQRGTSTAAEKDALKRHISQLTKRVSVEKQSVERMADDRLRWLELAMEFYGKTLYATTLFDLRAAFELVSLWVSNSEENIANQRMAENSNQSVVRKLIPLAYQLASRLGTGGSMFQETLEMIILEMGTHFPHSCLWQLLALSRGDMVPDTNRDRGRFAYDKDKVDVAKAMLDRIAQVRHGELVKQMVILADGYQELADIKPTDNDVKHGFLNLSSMRLQLVKVKNLKLLPIPTLRRNLSGEVIGFEDDAQVPHVVSFDITAVLVGGINAPKKVSCRGSDGKEYTQLVKGNDDLRQDAVMEQLFDIANELLCADADSAARNLHMRTYRVVPLSPVAGVLEWVNGTFPMAHYLLGASRNDRDSAHRRYRPWDWTSAECRAKLGKARQDGRNQSRIFSQICQNFKPVFRHFFLETFLEPTEWLRRRTNYTRSVAVSSMVGYIIGLGDRHSSNILVDRNTADVVHIDLGIAFDQGKFLMTPERVPFRLTRDLLDGMGPFGKEGTFRRCSEISMRVLRENRDVLTSVVEVFLYDPLFRWALSPLKRYAQQRNDELDDPGVVAEERAEELWTGNADATKALLRVREKLKGFEEEEVLTVEAHVHRLICEAVSPDNLAFMYEGWAPWV